MPKTNPDGHCHPLRVRLPLIYQEMLEEEAKITGLSFDKQAQYLIMECFERRIQKDELKCLKATLAEWEESFGDLRHIRQSILNGKIRNYHPVAPWVRLPQGIGDYRETD